METGKPGFVSVPVHSSSVAAQTEDKMDIQAPLTAVYVQTVPALPPHPYPQVQLPAAPQEPATIHLSMPPLFSKETFPFLTLHITGGLQSQQQELSLAAAAPAPAARPKSAGKHVCPHCGRDCMKPSVLEKHLRCHTGERPYPCTTCGISFKTQSNLYKHKRTQAHARLSSESEQSSLCSQDSLNSSRDTCTSSFSLDTHCEDSGNPAEIINPTSTVQVPSVEKQGPDTGWIPTMDTVNEQNDLSSQFQHRKPAESLEITRGEEKQTTENKKPPLTPNRHFPLQRQEATMFSKQWEHSISRGKSQSHDSTDSGFSESSDHYPSPGSVPPDHSMESLTESSLELLETSGGSQTPAEPGQSRQEPKASVAQREQRTLEERISKLISENDAVVEDKHLENVRPRRTVLSKQGSIDLPMPYTYKDSFHFDMRISKATNAGLPGQRPDRTGKPGLCCAVPTQRCTSIDHTPLTRSSSLPFSVAHLHSERGSPTSSFRRDYVTLARRGSSGQIYPSGFAMKSVNQQVSYHRPLVRQAAVDCNHAPEGLFINSSVEEACTSSFSSDGDSIDICGEPSNRKCRRKKAQKFAYSKWYMYGGGTFKKLYGTEKGCDNSVLKARKSFTNLEHEGVQGTEQRRLSAVNREISTINSTGSSAAVCHPSCLPAILPPVTSVDLNKTPSQLHSSCASLKSPLLKNVSSLCTLQSPSIVSLDTRNTDSANRAEAEKSNDNEKHTDSISQHCGGQIPSDRKKQKTDDKICPSGTPIDPNTSKTSTQPLSSVISGVAKLNGRPQIHNQDTNISVINLQSNHKPVQLKGALSTPCIINANGTSVSTSPTISIVSTAKTSFLPKYQLKLPTAVEPDSYSSPQTLNQPTGILSHDSTTSLSSHIDKTAITSSSSHEKKCMVHFIPLPPHGHTHCLKRTDCSAPSQSVSPLTAISHRQSVTSMTTLNHNVSPTLAITHGQFTTITTTTASEHDHCAKSYKTLIQNAPAKPVTAPMPNLPTTSIAPTTQNSSAPPIITTAHNLQSAAGFTIPSHGQHPSLSNAHALLTSDHLNPVHRVTAGLNTISCHIVPYDSAQQPAAQNVFHVRTADLHICLQIISDEQLALMEPQIERLEDTVRTGPSQRNNLDAMDPEVIRNKVQSSVTMENMNKGTDHEKTGHQKEEDWREPSSSHNTESIKPPLSVSFHQAQENAPVTEHGDVNQATELVESTPSKYPGLSLGQLSHTHKNMLTTTMKETDSAMSALVLLKGVKLKRNQTPKEEHVLPLISSAEEHHLQERSDSQEAMISETLPGQQILSLAGPASSSPSTAAQSSTGSGLLQEGSQHKRINQKAACLADKLKTKREASVYDPSEFAEARLSLQAWLNQSSHAESSSAECGDGLAGKVPSFPNSDCKTPRDVNPQAPVHSSDQRSCKLANEGGDGVGPLDHSTPSQVMTLNESQDNINSNLLETCLSLLPSVAGSIHVERPKDVTGVLTTNQSPAAGLREGGSLAGCAVQKALKTQDHDRRTPGQIDSADWELNQSQRSGEIDHLYIEGWEERGGVVEDSKNGGMMIIKTEDVPEQREAGSGSFGRCICLSDEIQPVEEEKNFKADSYKESKQHHQHLYQTQFGMSDNLPSPPQQEASTSSNPYPPSGGDASVSGAPWPESEANSVYFSQQSCEINDNHNRQTKIPFENNATLRSNQLSSLVQTQHVLYQSETNHQDTQQPIPNETMKHQNHQTQQDQEETNITTPTQPLPLRETAIHSNLPNCSDNSTYSTESQRVQSILAAVKPPTCTYPNLVSHPVHVNRVTVRTAANSQATSDGPPDNTIHPSKSWTSLYPDPDDEKEKADQATRGIMTHSSNAVRADGSNKYQSLLSTGQFHSYHLAEVLTSTRPVQSSQEDLDDTSSSDDEGKLIIEL